MKGCCVRSEAVVAEAAGNHDGSSFPKHLLGSRVMREEEYTQEPQ
jgi:hypothetical protein